MNTPNVRREEAPWAVLLKYSAKWNPTLDDERCEHFNSTVPYFYTLTYFNLN